VVEGGDHDAVGQIDGGGGGGGRHGDIGWMVVIGIFCCFGGGELLFWRLRMVYASYGYVV
jgi:hypothetical protein